MAAPTVTAETPDGDSVPGRQQPPAPVARVFHRPARPADLAAAGAVAGYLALLPLPSPVRALFVIAFMALGPGGAVLTWVDIPVRARVSTVPVLGMSIMTITTIAAMWSYRWNPIAILVVVTLAVTASSVLWYTKNSWPSLRAQGEPLVLPQWRNGLRRPAVVLTVLALLIWAAGLPWIPGVDANNMGLLFSGSGPALVVAIAVCTTAFVIAIRRRQLLAAVGALGAAIAISRLTTTLATEMPLYDWTYKHIAVVDYILVHDLIQPNGTDIYAQWPAFFVFAAWFCDVTGLSPITMAHLFAPVIHILIALTVFTAARVLKYSRRTALVACYVVEIVNWVGQDYFSPQAWTLILAYGLLVLLLASTTNRNAGILAIIPFAAMVPSHQLTPFWLLLTASLMVLTKRARPWWAVAAMVVIAGTYLALNFAAVAPYGILSGGSPVSNATSNFEVAGSSVEKFLTSGVCRGISVLVLASALAGTFWLRRRRQPALAAALLAFSPLALLLGQSYGGEAIFRVFLYGLLGCGLLIAPALMNGINGAAARPGLGRATAWCWITVSAVAGLHGYVALWPMIIETRAQVGYMEQLTTDIEPGTRVLMMHPGGMPTRVNDNYAMLTLEDPYFDQPLSHDLTGEKATFPTPDQLGAFQWAVENHEFPTYVMFSEQSRKAVEYYNEYPSDALARFQQFLGSGRDWEEVHRDGETLVFYHPGSGAAEERRAKPGHSVIAGSDWDAD
jgi:hypothetical protein